MIPSTHLFLFVCVSRCCISLDQISEMTAKWATLCSSKTDFISEFPTPPALFTIYIRAVKISVLIYAINVAAINAIKYFNAINATLFTSGVRCPLTRNRRVPT